MTVKEFFDTFNVQSTVKILSSYNGRVLCYKFNSEKHKDIGEREIRTVFADLSVQEKSFGKHADPIISLYVNGHEDYEKERRKKLLEDVK